MLGPVLVARSVSPSVYGLLVEREDPSQVTEITSSVGSAVVGTALGILTNP
jgi:hypothetical protein